MNIKRESEPSSVSALIIGYRCPYRTQNLATVSRNKTLKPLIRPYFRFIQQARCTKLFGTSVLAPSPRSLLIDSLDE